MPKHGALFAAVPIHRLPVLLNPGPPRYVFVEHKYLYIYIYIYISRAQGSSTIVIVQMGRRRKKREQLNIFRKECM